MVTAYETVVLKSCSEFVNPTSLVYPTMKHEKLIRVCDTYSRYFIVSMLTVSAMLSLTFIYFVYNRLGSNLKLSAARRNMKTKYS